MTVRVDVAPALLKWAVERAGWDDETVDRRAPRLHEWVAGTVKPTLKQLEKFAHDTHVPFGLLFLPEPPVEELPIADMRTFRNDPVRRTSADLLETIYSCQERQEWYRAHAEESGIDDLDFVGSAAIKDDPVAVADVIRTRLNLETNGAFRDWSTALRELRNSIENTGVLVMISGIVGSNTHRVLDPQEFRGFALADPIAPLIFVNGADTKAAQIFTLVHELAHIFLGTSAVSDADVKLTVKAPEEQWCNRIAAEVLVPLEDLRIESFGQTDVVELDRLAAKFRVSTLVIVNRLLEAGTLSWDEYLRVFDAERVRVLSFLEDRQEGGSGGNYYYTQPVRLSRRFAQAVIGSTFEGTTTYREAYRLLGTRSHSTFQRMAEELGAA